MIKLLSSKKIIGFTHIDNDTGEYLQTFIDLGDIYHIHEAKNSDKDKYQENIFNIDVSGGTWLAVGDMQETVQIWNNYKETKNLLATN